MASSSWPSPPPQGSPPPRRQVPGWAKATGVGIAAFILGSGIGGGDAEPVSAPIEEVTQTETERERVRSTETETVTEAAPTVTATVTEMTTVAAAPPPEPEPEPVPQPLAPPPPASVYYENCDAARAAGAAPVYRGEPGYGAHLDRDDDGIGCE